MSSKRSNIYNWERFSKPRVYSRSQRLTKDGDIQDWIKKVEDASTRAAAATFGAKYIPSRQSTQAAITATVDDVRLHNAAYAEAQELLEQWVTEKLDFGNDEEFVEETWTKKTETEIRREWDQLLGSGEDPCDMSLDDIAGRTLKPEKDPYSILDKDDASMVGDVMQRLLDKHVVGADVLTDLGLENTITIQDPRTKMKLRHQQVKENREKRERERKRKLVELQAKKDAYIQAKQIIKKENQAKALQRKREEEAIQREMAKIRKEMEEEKKRHREETLREQKEKEQFKHCVQEEVKQQNMELDNAERQHHLQEQCTQKLILERLQEMETKEARDNLKLLQKCFSSWYGLLLQRHLQIGKAKAMADWKLVLKTFNAWKSYTRSKHLEKEAFLQEMEIKILQRKQLLAEKHYRSQLLRKCFLAWQLYIIHQRHKKDTESQKHQTKDKMAAFLEAATSGKLWSAKSDTESQNKTTDNESASQKVADIFQACGRRASPPDEKPYDSSTAGGRKRTNSGPNQLQAWQITRKHAQVTKEDLAKICKSDAGDKSEEPKGRPAKAKKPAVINNYEHRHLAQQKILEMQQKQIKEQQHLIEEMQYLQKQQMLQQQLAQQHLAQEKCGWVTAGNKGTAVKQLEKAKGTRNDTTNYQTIVTDLQIEDLENSNDIISDTGHNNNNEHENTSRTENKSTISSLMSNNKSINFLKTMEERAQERARLKREREEKRRQAEEERLKALQAQEEERQKEEEEEKRRRAEAYREKKRIEKQKELERQKQLEQTKRLMEIAQTHSRLALMKYRGWLPWKQLITMARKNTECAREHHENMLLRKVLLKWHGYVEEDLTHKKALADDMLNYIVIRRCFNNWKKVGSYMLIQEEKARRHFEVNLKSKVIRLWANYAVDEKMEMWKKERLAKEHNTKRVVLTALRAWRRFPHLIRAEEERRHRLEEMRKKVSSLLPDFSGTSISQKSTEFSL